MASTSIILGLMLVQLNAISTFNYTFDDSTGLGRRFDGIGAISGGGATSKLLVNYPQPQRDEIFDYLFKPNFGASLQLLKIEIGGDMQSTDGSEATHMRSATEENYERGYEWWFMLEAKKRNPDLQLIGLPWGWPGWLGGKTGGVLNVFDNPQQTALYVVKWILGAKSKYGLHIDYVGIWNESPYTTEYIKVLRKTLDAHALQSTLIVAADDIRDWDEISAQVLADPDLADSIYAIGVHYPNTTSSLLALDTGKPLWASEDHPDKKYLLWNVNYVDGYMSGTVMWPALCSWYKGLPYYGAGLMNASEPWSGHYNVPDLVYLAAHSTQFSKPGWTFLKHGSGVGRFANGGNYVALVSPDKKDFTIVIDHVDASDVGQPVQEELATFQLKGSFASIKELNVWFTQLDDNPALSKVFQKRNPLQIVDGRFTLNLGINQVYTLTTLTSGNKGSHPEPPPSKPFPLPYSDNFDNYREFEEPYMISPQTGAYEATTVEGHGKVMRQMTWQTPVKWYWCHTELAGVSLAVVGQVFWQDMYIETDVYINSTMSERATGVYLAVRLDHGGCRADNNTGIFFYFYPEDKTYLVSSDLRRNIILNSGSIVNMESDGWNKLALNIKGSVATGYVNGKAEFIINNVPDNIMSGFPALGTASYGAADFDNLLVSEPK